MPLSLRQWEKVQEMLFGQASEETTAVEQHYRRLSKVHDTLVSLEEKILTAFGRKAYRFYDVTGVNPGTSGGSGNSWGREKR